MMTKNLLCWLGIFLALGCVQSASSANAQAPSQSKDAVINVPSGAVEYYKGLLTQDLISNVALYEAAQRNLSEAQVSLQHARGQEQQAQDGLSGWSNTRLEKAEQAVAAAKARAAQNGANENQQTVQAADKELRVAQEAQISLRRQSLVAEQNIIDNQQKISALTPSVQSAQMKIRQDLSAFHRLGKPFV